MTPLAVTGVGVVSPVGVGLPAFAAALRDPGADAFTATPSTFDAAPYPGARVAELAHFDATPWLGDKGLRNTDRLTRLFLVGTRLALEDAGIKRAGSFAALGPGSVGVCAATAYGSLEAITELNRVAQLEDPRYLNPARFPNTVINSALGYVSIWEDLRALNVTVTNGTCGALDAMFCAATHLLNGRAEALVVGGAEAMSEALYLAFHRVGALDARPDGPGGPDAPGARAWAPGSPDSAGLRLGEGAALLVMEPADAAAARGARVRAEITGYGTAFEPPTRDGLLMDPSPVPLRRAIRDALRDAAIGPGDVDVVASGLAGHPVMDRAEFAALDALPADVCVAAPKARTGDCLGAAGALAVAAAAAWFDGAPVGDVVRGRAPARVRTVLVLALGFYGNASAVVVTAPGVNIR